MKWFYNLKIATKLIMSFIIVAIIAGVVGIIGIINLRNVNNAGMDLYENNTVPLPELTTIIDDYQRIRVNLRELAFYTDTKILNDDISNVKNFDNDIQDNLNKYEKSINNDDVKKQFDNLKTTFNNEFIPYQNNIINLYQSNHQNQIEPLLEGQGNTINTNIETSLNSLLKLETDSAKQKFDSNAATTNAATVTMIIILLLGIIIAISLGIFISRIISKPVNMMVKAANKLAVGDINVNVESNTKDEIGSLAESFRRMIANVHDQAKVAEKIADGDLDIEILPKSDKDVLNMRLNEMLETIKSLITEMNKLYEQQKAGDIDAFMNIKKFKGAYREVANGVNEGYKLHINNILKLLAILTSYAEGDFSAVLEKLPGKQALANEKVDLLKENLLNIINEMVALSKSATEGNLAVRGDINKFHGDFKKIIVGINDTLDATIKPINEAVSVLEEMAKGNLQVNVNGDHKGDHGIIKNAINNTLSSFNEVLGNISSASEQVASGAKQVSDSSMALSQGATEQASSVEELTASLEEISSQTKLNAENASQANELAEVAKSNAVQGNTQMKEMLKSMEEINDASANISKIIKVIDEIAFQTNILALNAAVEAARAGQHGKGFAVVAEEVRNLAARSADAAKETTVLIEGSIKKVEDGTKIANDTADALNEIVDGVSKTATLVGQIASASNEQASGIAQINQGIMQVSQVIQANSSTSEESAAASEELSSQAVLLKEMVGKFTLKQNVKFYNDLSELNPEVLRMLEKMSKKKNVKATHANDAYEEAAVTKSRIALSDKEFGKY